MTIFVWCLDVFFSFFKQKTAYEMRISDWRSDVCSSDLRAARTDPFDALAEALRATGLYPYCIGLFDGKIVDLERETRGGFAVGRARSEEHTSELQSLMRISYAVFCLKKKKNNHSTNIYAHHKHIL